MERIAIAGVGMTPFSKRSDVTVRSLAQAAAEQALEDANILPSDVEAVFFSNATEGLITGQEMIRGQTALRHTGLLGLPIFNLENACASGSTGFHLAWMSLASGIHDIVLAVGAERLTHPDKHVSFSAIGSARDLAAEGELHSHGDTPVDRNRSPFMDIYARRARSYMEGSGATVEDLADVAVKNHAHGALNPLAQYRQERSREEVLESREIVPPLRLLMCSPIGNGAAAAVLMSRAALRRHRVENPVWVRASVVLSGGDRADDEPTVLRRAARRSYQVGSLEPVDIDVAEVHDAAAPGELIAYEELELCHAGEGPALLAAGTTRLGGQVPVNPSGGLLARGHPIGATGLAQISEIVWQLRGAAGRRQVENAKIGLAQNGGGFLGNDTAAMAIHLLSTT